MTSESAARSAETGPGGRKSAVRERILDTAVQLFADLGFAATTMDRVAVEAKVARATVFNHFESKELLVDAAVRRHYLGFADFMRFQSESTAEFHDQITEGLSRWAMSFAQDVDAVIPMVHSWVHAGGPLLPGSDMTADLLADIICREQKGGRLPTSLPAVVIGRALSDSLTGALLRWTLEENPTPESLRDSLLATTNTINLRMTGRPPSTPVLRSPTQDPDVAQDTASPASGTHDRKGVIRDRILAAAVTLFGDLGYTNTTMERIASEAGVARATVFNHFAHKELLLSEVLVAHHLSFVDILRKDTDPTQPLRDRIMDAEARWTMAYAHDVDAALPLIRAWVNAGGPLLPTADATADVLAEMISEAQAGGSLPSTGSPTVIGRAMSDALTGAMIRWTTEETPTAESLRDTMLDAVRAIDLE